MKSNLRVCCVDNIGAAYLPIALHLREYFDSEIGYYSVNQSPFPYIQNDIPGTGYDGIRRVDEFWSTIDEWDLFIFPDIYFCDWGKTLRGMGKMVFGGNDSEMLETDREVFYREKELVGLPNIKTDIVKGVKNLIVYCEKNENKWIKVSYYRGIQETFHHTDFKNSQIFLNNLVAQLGPLGDEMTFIIEDNLKAVAELGSDGFTINGIFPNSTQWGVEIKDCAYIGKWDIKQNLPLPINFVNDKFTTVLQKFGHTGFFSSEIRYSEDGKSYFTDPCMRAGSPPSNCVLKMISNWDEILPQASQGIVVEPKFKAKYCCEIILKDTYCNTNFLAVNFPDEFIGNVFLKNSFIRDGVYYIAPFNKAGFELDAFGSVVVIGDELHEIIDEALYIASQVDTYNLTYDKSALSVAMKTIDNLEQVLNIQF